jgi:homogentisate 1,2-dioxygenase
MSRYNLIGPIGSNGLANPRDFEIPSAFYERIECDFTVNIVKDFLDHQ